MNTASKRIQSVFETQTQHKWVNKASSAEERIEKLLKLKAAVKAREELSLIHISEPTRPY